MDCRGQLLVPGTERWQLQASEPKHCAEWGVWYVSIWRAKILGSQKLADRALTVIPDALTRGTNGRNTDIVDL
jgi:hypothetical protein